MIKMNISELITFWELKGKTIKASKTYGDIWSVQIIDTTFGQAETRAHLICERKGVIFSRMINANLYHYNGELFIKNANLRDLVYHL